MLAEMPRQTLHFLTKLKKFANTMIGEIKASILELASERIVGIGVFPGADQAGEAVERFRVEGKHLADFSRGRFATVSDDVGGHGGAEFSVALVNVLDSALALISAGKIKIDVRPFATLFRKKTLEKQVHSDGIDGRDAKRVADRTVGGRSATLNQDVVFVAETDDVP